MDFAEIVFITNSLCDNIPLIMNMPEDVEFTDFNEAYDAYTKIEYNEIGVYKALLFVNHKLTSSKRTNQTYTP